MISNCIICGVEYRKTRKDKVTCSKTCSRRRSELKKRGKIIKTETITTQIDLDNIKLIEPFLLEWKRRKFLLNEVDIFNALDLWDRIYPNKFISNNYEKQNVFEDIITDIILYYKRFNKKISSQ